MTKRVDIGTSAAEPYVAGDYLQLLVTIKDVDDAALNLSGMTAARYTIAQEQPGAITAQVSKTLGSGITVTDAANGQVRVTIDNGDTDGLQGAYRHELEITDSASRATTVLVGKFQITRAALT